MKLFIILTADANVHSCFEFASTAIENQGVVSLPVFFVCAINARHKFDKFLTETSIASIITVMFLSMYI